MTGNLPKNHAIFGIRKTVYGESVMCYILTNVHPSVESSQWFTEPIDGKSHRLNNWCGTVYETVESPQWLLDFIERRKNA